MEHNRIALIASLDTKLQETLYAKHEIESCGGQGLIIDISTKTLVDAGDAVGPADILARYGMTWEEFPGLRQKNHGTICGRQGYHGRPHGCRHFRA